MKQSTRFWPGLALGILLMIPLAAFPEDACMPEPYVQMEHPERSRDGVIYQINTRQFTPEGTFAAAAKQLPRLKALGIYHYTDENSWPHDAMRMLFVGNHDKNAWEATQFEAFGDALENAIVLSVVSKGMPLIYNGQEAGNTRRPAYSALSVSTSLELSRFHPLIR